MEQIQTTFTLHSACRAAQRNLSSDDIQYIIIYGQRLHRAGAVIYYLRKRDIPLWDQNQSIYMRLAGSAVVFSRDGRAIITVWRNCQKGLKHIRCKSTHSWEARTEEDYL